MDKKKQQAIVNRPTNEKLTEPPTDKAIKNQGANKRSPGLVTK